jgi:hypothetical protein
MAAGGLYASMWNRQRQAEKAREELAVALEQEQRLEGQKITDGHIRAGAPITPAVTEASERVVD